MNIGLRMGWMNFIRDYGLQESSNAEGDLDFALETGGSLQVSNKFLLNAGLIYGLTKYDYIIGMPIQTPSYFKYHTFQFGLAYILHEN
jgi:hypothetical protein